MARALLCFSIVLCGIHPYHAKRAALTSMENERASSAGTCAQALSESSEEKTSAPANPTKAITDLLAALPPGTPQQSPAIAKLLSAFRCGDVEIAVTNQVSKIGALPVFALGCNGPTDSLAVAQALLATAGMIASISGVGLPIGAVLLMTSNILGLWRESAGKEAAEDDLVKNLIRQAVGQIKNFALERDLSQARSRSLSLRDRLKEVCLMQPLESCNDVILSEWLRADNDAGVAMNDILSDADIFLDTKYEVTDADDAAIVTARVELLEGLQSVWISMAFNRLELMVNAISKVKDCPEVTRWMQIVVDHTMLKSEKQRLDKFAARWKPVREDMQNAVAAQKVGTVTKDLLQRTRWGSLQEDSVVVATPLLLLLRAPGRKVLEELLQDSTGGVILAVVKEIARGMATWSTGSPDVSGHPDIILPLFGALVKTLKPCVDVPTCYEYRKVIVFEILAPLAHMGLGTPNSYGVKMREDSDAFEALNRALRSQLSEYDGGTTPDGFRQRFPIHWVTMGLDLADFLQDALDRSLLTKIAKFDL